MQQLLLLIVSADVAVAGLLLLYYSALQRQMAESASFTSKLFYQYADTVFWFCRAVVCSPNNHCTTITIESCVWRTVSSQSSHHSQEVLLAQFSLYVHKGGLKPDSFHFYYNNKPCYYHIILNPFKPEFTIVIFIHYKPRIAVAILDL